MAGFLAAGAGAHAGVDEMLDRYMKEDEQARLQAQLNETIRSNQAREQIGRDTNAESAAVRREGAASLDASKKRDDARAWLALVPPIHMSTQEIDDYEKVGGAPHGMFDMDQLNSATDPNFQGPEQPAEGGTFKGTASAQQSADRVQQAQERLQYAMQNGADRLEIARLNLELQQAKEQRLKDWGPPTVTIGDPNMPGGARVIGRDQLPQGGAPAPVPGAIQGQIIGNETAEQQLGRLETMFNGDPAHGVAAAKDMIGPLEGRARSIGQSIPGVPVDSTYAQFEAASNAFKNAVIKAITGAQMSEQEATRIMGQIPTVNDKPEVWAAKAQQTRQNLQDISRVVGGRQGATPAGPAPAAPGAAPAAPTGRVQKWNIRGEPIPY